MDHMRLSYSRTRPLDVLILTTVVLLTVGSTFAWLDFKSRDAEQTRQIADLQMRLAVAESKGASTVIFQMPEVRGTPYVNIDQKGFDLSVPPTPVPTTNGKRTPTGSTPSKSEISKPK